MPSANNNNNNKTKKQKTFTETRCAAEQRWRKGRQTVNRELGDEFFPYSSYLGMHHS